MSDTPPMTERTAGSGSVDSCNGTRGWSFSSTARVRAAQVALLPAASVGMLQVQPAANARQSCRKQ
jgi:hypothetical protein